MQGVRTGRAHDYKVDCPSPSMPLVYASRSLFEVPRGFSVAVRASTGGGAQAGGEGKGSMCIHCALLPSPLLPFTVCVRSLSGVLWWAGGCVGGVAVAVLFALWRLLCCLLLLYDGGLGRD